MLPTYGFCHGVFLLVRTATIKERQGKGDWLIATKNVPTMVAQATALDQLIDYLEDRHLVNTTNGRIQVDERLVAICTNPDLITFGEIAKFFLIQDPPSWVRFSFSKDSFQQELLPTEAEDGLAWLKDIMDGVIFEAWRYQRQDDSFKKWLGDLGESFVISGEKASEHSALQVSRISDAYGFDILSKNGRIESRLEVKAVVESTADGFYLSRNEYEKALLFPDSWQLLQVVFSPDVLDAELVTSEMVVQTRSLNSADVTALVPRDLPTGQWLEVARITAPSSLWRPVKYPNFYWKSAGFKKFTSRKLVDGTSTLGY